MKQTLHIIHVMRNSIKKKYYLIPLCFVLLSCAETEYPILFPERYFPAYPGSYWVYSNGETVKVNPDYQEHSYYTEFGSTERSQIVLAPCIDNQYVYQYSITQNNTVIPLRTFLKIGEVAEWRVDTWENDDVFRKMEHNNTTLTLILDSNNGVPTVFDSVVTVVEFLGSGNDSIWRTREWYALDVGLVKREINTSHNSIAPYTDMELIRYQINN